MRRGPFDRALWSLKRGFFKTVELNVVGWSALVGAGLALGLVVVLVADVSPAIALPASVIVAWLVLLALDHIRWRNSMIGLGRGNLDRATGEAIVADLRERGIDATYQEYPYDSYDAEDAHGSIRCRHADAEIVNGLLDQYLNRTE